ncbi:MAG TPA: tail fiber domain-containing protein [Devosiaceae bacterium]|jgi:hypothetical protein|nr:tail fiber domain-containing protein [Devosiaceae bacterium]
MAIRFPVAQGIWIGSASHMIGQVQNESIQVEGVLVYDSTAKTLKLCDGTNWIDLADSGSDVSAAGSVGQIQFNDGSDGLAADAGLHWDNVNKRLGIGTATPGEKLVVEAGGIHARNTSGSWFEAHITDNSNSGVFRIRDSNNNTVAQIVGSELDGSGNGKVSFSAADAWSFMDGNFGIGTTSPGEALEINGNLKTSANGIMPNFVLDSSSSGDNWTEQGAYISLGEGASTGSAATMHVTYVGNGMGYTGAGTVAAGIPSGGYWRYKYNSGEVYTTANVYAANYYHTSDRRLKSNIQTYRGGLDAVLAMRGVTFNWKESGKPASGVLAQELQSVMPSAVSASENDKGEGVLAVDYDQIVAPLIEAVKELKTANDNQSFEIEALRSEIQALKAAR